MSNVKPWTLEEERMVTSGLYETQEKEARIYAMAHRLGVKII